jgi:hypothetical protein
MIRALIVAIPVLWASNAIAQTAELQPAERKSWSIRLCPNR